MSWHEQAACRDHSPDLFYPPDPIGRPRKTNYISAAQYAPARAICDGCPVRDQCLTEAMATERGASRHGMFGGLTPRERGALPWRICVECRTKFPARRSGVGGSVPRYCGDECRDIARRRQFDAELARQRRARMEDVA